MPFPQEIKDALKKYDNEKGLGRKLFGDQEAIQKLRRLPPEDQDNLLKILQCFFNNEPNRYQSSYMVYSATLLQFDPHGYDIFKWSSIFSKSGILTQENFDTIRKSKKPDVVAEAIYLLHKAKMDTNSNINNIVHYNTSSHITALKFLQANKIFTQENLNILIKKNNDPILIASVIKDLDDAGLLTEKNRNSMINCEDGRRSQFCKAIHYLSKVEILTQENFQALITFNKIQEMSSILSILKKVNILTQKNFQALFTFDNLQEMAGVLFLLKRSEILTQENFNHLLSPKNASLSTQEVLNQVWHRLPSHLLNQELFNELVIRAQQPSPLLTLSQYVRQLLNRQKNNGRYLNPEQSGHTNSVDLSASESALRLKQRYNKELKNKKLANILEEIKKYVIALPNDGIKNEAAKRCIQEITSSEDFIDYKEQTSNISLKELLGFVWLAMNDAATRITSFADAKNCLIQALYEIQRGYNLSGLEPPEDDGKEDKPICDHVAFNKFIEKFCTVHPDFQMVYITKEVATLKLQSLVQQEIRTHLKKLACQCMNQKSIENFKQLIEDINNNDVNKIWGEVKIKIMNEMPAELADLFKTEDEFIQFVDSGQYLTFNINYTEFQNEIQKTAKESKLPNGELSSSVSLFPSQDQNKKDSILQEKKDSLDFQI